GVPGDFPACLETRLPADALVGASRVAGPRHLRLEIAIRSASRIAFQYCLGSFLASGRHPPLDSSSAAAPDRRRPGISQLLHVRVRFLQARWNAGTGTASEPGTTRCCRGKEWPNRRRRAAGRHGAYRHPVLPAVSPVVGWKLRLCLRSDLPRSFRRIDSEVDLAEPTGWQGESRYGG